MSDYLDCQSEGFIKDLERAKSWVNKEITVAEKFLKSAKINIVANQYEVTVITGYLVIFHINRALVYNKGKITKKHLCVIVAAKELYKENKDIIEFLSGAENALISRNHIQYDGYDADKEMAVFIVNLAEDYLDFVKELLKL